YPGLARWRVAGCDRTPGRRSCPAAGRPTAGLPDGLPPFATPRAVATAAHLDIAASAVSPALRQLPRAIPSRVGSHGWLRVRSPPPGRRQYLVRHGPDGLPADVRLFELGRPVGTDARRRALVRPEPRLLPARLLARIQSHHGLCHVCRVAR